MQRTGYPSACVDERRRMSRRRRTLVRMSARRSFPRIAVIASIAVLAVSLFAIADGRGDDGRPSLRTNPNIGPFQGLGTWIDLYDDSAWRDPASAVASMAAQGVRTLYLETSNFKRPYAVVDRSKVAAFVDAAKVEGVQIVAWYLPGFVDVALDARRSLAAIRFRTGAGNRFDGFALDIEASDVANVATRNARLLTLSRRLRSFAGDRYPLGAIIPSPRGIVVNKGYWPGFPYADLAAIYDTLMPMSYFTWRHPTAESTRLYLTQDIRIIRREVGSDQEPIHVIGGIAQDASVAQTRAFVEVLRERGVIGGSYYTFPGVDAVESSVLQQIPVNPVQSPAMPVAPGPAELGNIPGSDTTHGTGVVYAVGGFAGDRTLTYDAFDAQAAEITISVNWVTLATVEVGPDGAWTGPRQVVIPDAMLVDGQTNTIAFIPNDPGATWGVRGVSVTRAARPTVSPSASG